MGETLPSWKPSCNLSVSVQLSERKTSSDAGAFLLREVLDRSGVIESLDRQLLDDRDPARVQHSLSSQLRTLLVQRALGWDDLSDTQTLANDPVLQLACSDQRSTTPLEQPRPSQPTLSRLLNLLATDSGTLRFIHRCFAEQRVICSAFPEAFKPFDQVEACLGDVTHQPPRRILLI